MVALIIIISFFGNVFDYLSLKADEISLREPLLDFYPILAGFVGFIFFPAERHVIHLLAFVAGTLVIWRGIHKLKINKTQRMGLGYLVLGISFYSILPSLYKEL